jgi:hypothetical protein
MTPPLPVPHVPISWGELIDKITILEIKVRRLSDAAACANVDRELALLRDIAAPAQADAQIAQLADQLRRQNEALWDIEDRIRDKERAGQFDADFIALARSVYQSNDRRGALKREINLALGSVLIEEKSYRPY